MAEDLAEVIVGSFVLIVLFTQVLPEVLEQSQLSPQFRNLIFLGMIIGLVLMVIESVQS